MVLFGSHCAKREVGAAEPLRSDRWTVGLSDSVLGEGKGSRG